MPGSEGQHSWPFSSPPPPHLGPLHTVSLWQNKPLLAFLVFHTIPTAVLLFVEGGAHCLREAQCRCDPRVSQTPVSKAAGSPCSCEEGCNCGESNQAVKPGVQSGMARDLPAPQAACPSPCTQLYASCLPSATLFLLLCLFLRTGSRRKKSSGGRNPALRLSAT